jgi:hypothetical protein
LNAIVTTAELTSICEKLYGPRWQSALARELVRDPRTIRRWASGECPVPKVVVEWLGRREASEEFTGHTGRID